MDVEPEEESNFEEYEVPLGFLVQQAARRREQRRLNQKSASREGEKEAAVQSLLGHYVKIASLENNSVLRYSILFKSRSVSSLCMIASVIFVNHP